MTTSEEQANHWRVRWETPDGMMTFVQIHREAPPVTRSEVEGWAQQQVQSRPDELARVACCYVVQENEA